MPPALNEPQERAAAEEEWKSKEAKNREYSQRLDALYKEKGDEWVRTLVARVIGE